MPCQDDDYFLDELGFRCLDWANSDCALAESDGLSYGGMMDLYKYCPVSCIPYGCDSSNKPSKTKQKQNKYLFNQNFLVLLEIKIVIQFTLE